MNKKNRKTKTIDSKFDLDHEGNFSAEVEAEITKMEEKYWYDQMQNFVETCDWCGGGPVVYHDEAHDLCENCADQMFGN